jgi:hypothetical protein
MRMKDRRTAVQARQYNENLENHRPQMKKSERTLHSNVGTNVQK